MQPEGPFSLHLIRQLIHPFIPPVYPSSPHSPIIYPSVSPSPRSLVSAAGGIWGYGAPSTDLICLPEQLPWPCWAQSCSHECPPVGGGSLTNTKWVSLAAPLPLFAGPPSCFQQRPPAPFLLCPVLPSPLRPLASTDTLKRGPIITSRGGPAQFALNLQAVLCPALCPALPAP